jgi:Fe-S oxidoreductase
VLSLAEKIAYLVLAGLCVLVAAPAFMRIARLVRQGRPAERSDGLVGRFVTTLVDIGLQRPMFKARPLASTFHAFIFFGFSFYLLVNLNDLVLAFVPGWTTLGRGPVFDAFNLASDLLSIAVLTGMIFFLVRRFVVRPKVLEFNSNVVLHPKVAAGGIKRDSLVVGVFILLHVGGRWTGTAMDVAQTGHFQATMPTASVLAMTFSGMPHAALETGAHVGWWVAMGLIALFLPYFPRSKHIHLMIAPVNLALGRKTPRGQLDAPADKAAPGAAKVSELPWPQILNSYACIMCTRCQEVCPAHASGAPLSPAALEINKRYALNDADDAPVLEVAISDDAIWSCTTCYACVRVCPVGNEPMHDLVELRRKLVMDAKVPDLLATALKNLDENGNSFGESARKRSQWTKTLDSKPKDAAKEEVEYLWFVGDFASFNQKCQDVSRKVARVLTAAEVDFGILYKGESSAGNDVRRVGEEGLFESLAEKNIKILAECKFAKILTTDPHTYNAIKNEYPKLGATFEVVHYSELLLELVESGKIRLEKKLGGKATYHDPCYLGRYNGIYDPPRELIRRCGVELVEMPRNREGSFCCGAGGGRIWMKDQKDVKRRPSELRIDEAAALPDVRFFTVACPKDMTMFSDAVKTAGHEGDLEVRDIIDYVADAMVWPGVVEHPDKEKVA